MPAAARLVPALLFSALTMLPAGAAPVETCHAIEAADARLRCYDTATQRPNRGSSLEQFGNWTFEPAIDRMSDHRFYNAFLRPVSGSPDLLIRLQCDRVLYVTFFSAAFNRFGRYPSDNRLSYRFESQQAVSLSMMSYSEGSASFLSDDMQDAFIEALKSEARLLVRFEGQSNYQFRESEFDTAGFNALLARVAEHCPAPRQLPAEEYRTMDCRRLLHHRERRWCSDAQEAGDARAPIPPRRPAR